MTQTIQIINYYLQEKEGTRPKILTSKQMLQRLPPALTQVKAGNNSENLLNEIRQIVILCINQKNLLNIIKLIQTKV